MENKNTSSTTNEGLKEIDKQTNPVMYGWRCPICGRVYSPEECILLMYLCALIAAIII